MSAATPAREVRLSEIPTELRNLRAEIDRWRHAHAMELTRANALERELEQTRRARDAARKTVDDLTAHSVAQGDYIARLDIDVRVRDKALAEAERRINRLRDRADKLAEWIENEITDQGLEPCDMRELIEAAGVECVVCDGKGWVADEEMIGDPGAAYGYRTRDVKDECEECDGIGKRLR